MPYFQKNLYNPKSDESFRLSRSKIDLFMDCPRCFYLDRRLGISQPSGFPFSLNSAVDRLLKREFDSHRAKGTAHPLMKAYGLKAIPLDHELIDLWRDSLGGGIACLHKPTNFLITGGIDDVWVNERGEYLIVDYKSTAKESEVNLDAEWQNSYKRQMEVYQWLFRQNGFRVNNTGFFVYCNGKVDAKAFDGKLEFSIKLIPYVGKTEWIEPTLMKIHECLNSDKLPSPSLSCEYCRYRAKAQAIETSDEKNQLGLGI